MQHDLIIDERLRIPRSELVVSYARSSGPGGQNVNKVSSKAMVRWDIVATAALPEDVRARLVAQCGRRLTAAGELLIASDRHREQGRNLADCFDRLRALVQAAARAPIKRRATRPPRSASESRLREKKTTGARKQTRRDVSGDD
ncbi:MAG: alternative ribosome rescue aminoacyl-tRNA hydrolase ArfB [Lacipirellulaceae bacterium]